VTKHNTSKMMPATSEL